MALLIFSCVHLRMFVAVFDNDRSERCVWIVILHHLHRYCQRVIDEWFTIGWQIADAAGSASISVNVEYNASKNDAPNGWIGFGFAGSSDGDAMNQAYAIIGGAMEGGSDGRLTGPDEIPAAPLRRRFTRSEASTEPPEASLTVEEFKLPSSGKASTASIRAGKLQDSALENAMIIRAPGKKFIMAFTRNLVSVGSTLCLPSCLRLTQVREYLSPCSNLWKLDE